MSRKFAYPRTTTHEEQQEQRQNQSYQRAGSVGPSSRNMDSHLAMSSSLSSPTTRLVSAAETVSNVGHSQSKDALSQQRPDQLRGGPTSLQQPSARNTRGWDRQQQQHQPRHPPYQQQQPSHQKHHLQHQQQQQQQQQQNWSKKSTPWNAGGKTTTTATTKGAPRRSSPTTAAAAQLRSTRQNQQQEQQQQQQQQPVIIQVQLPPTSTWGQRPASGGVPQQQHQQQHQQSIHISSQRLPPTNQVSTGSPKLSAVATPWGATRTTMNTNTNTNTNTNNTKTTTSNTAVTVTRPSSSSSTTTTTTTATPSITEVAKMKEHPIPSERIMNPSNNKNKSKDSIRPPMKVMSQGNNKNPSSVPPPTSPVSLPPQQISKSNKNKPKLNSISIGDMIKEPTIVKRLTSTATTAASTENRPQDDNRKGQQTSQPQTNRQQQHPLSTNGNGDPGRTSWQMDNTEDFPSLSATPLSSSGSSSEHYNRTHPQQTQAAINEPSKATVEVATTPKLAWGITVPPQQQQQKALTSGTSKGFPPIPQLSSTLLSSLTSAGNNNNDVVVKNNYPSKILRRDGGGGGGGVDDMTLLAPRNPNLDVVGSKTTHQKPKSGAKSNSSKESSSNNNMKVTNSDSIKSKAKPLMKSPSAVDIGGGKSQATTTAISAMDFFKARPRINTGIDSLLVAGSGKTTTSSTTTMTNNNNNTTNRHHTRLDGDEHALLRLLQERTVYQKKGRQRLAPRKKRFTPLKKKVLQERLKKWRELHPPENEKDSNTVVTESGASGGFGGVVVDDYSNSPSTTLCILQYVSVDDLEDDDNYEEILEDLKIMATKIGQVEDTYIPSPATVKAENSNDDDYDDVVRQGTHPVFVRFEKKTDAAAAKACWDGLVVGGNKLEVLYVDVLPLSPSSSDTSMQDAVRVVLADLKRRNHHQESMTSDTSNKATDVVVGPVEIVLQKVLTQDDYDDDDCMRESLDDLKTTAEQYGGGFVDLRPSNEKDGNVILTYECSSLQVAKDIAASLCSTVIGGVPLYAFVNEMASSTVLSSSSSATVVLTNVITDDDLEDDDCLNETLNDIRELSMKYGEVSDVVVNGKDVSITYIDGIEVAKKAVGELNGLQLGGNAVGASLLLLDQSTESDVTMSNNNNGNDSILLHNLLTQEDLDDEDCIEESLRDVRELASKYGVVSTIDVLRADDGSSALVRVTFDGATTANDVTIEAAINGFDGMVLGGQIVSATRPSGEENAQNNISSDGVGELSSSGDKRKPNGGDASVDTTSNNTKKVKTDDTTKPLYSRDKLIPERFAEMKRVPKVTNAPGPRDYATVVNDESVKPLLIEMLGELMRLQKRAIDENNTKAKRRLVMGLREVARGIRSHKVKMVVMATNLDEYGVIDDKLQEIIDLAKSEGVPLIFEFTKRTLGKALGKSIKIAVVGIQNADGAHQPFKKLTSIAGR